MPYRPCISTGQLPTRCHSPAVPLDAFPIRPNPLLPYARLSPRRAFRSRFLELHVDDIPDDELATILEKRCGGGGFVCTVVGVGTDTGSRWHLVSVSEQGREA